MSMGDAPKYAADTDLAHDPDLTGPADDTDPADTEPADTTSTDSPVVAAGSTAVPSAIAVDARPKLARRTIAAIAWSVLALTLWSICTPLWTSPDSDSHVVNAINVAHGRIAPVPNDDWSHGGRANSIAIAPSSIVESAASVECYFFKPEVSAACILPIDDDETLTEQVNSAGRNVPTYYLLTGLPSLFTEPSDTVPAMRVVAIAAGAVLLGWAISAALSYRRRAIAFFGVFAATTPMVLYLSGVVNPNGLEITASIAMTTCSLAYLAAPPGSPISHIFFRRAMLAAAVMVSIRLLAPGWALVWLVAFLALHNRRQLRVDRGRKLAWASLPALGILANGLWTIKFDVGDLNIPPPADLTGMEAFFSAKRFIEDGTLTQAIGAFGWLDTAAPLGSIRRYFFAVVIVLGVLAVTLALRQLLIVLYVTFSAYAVPIALQAWQWNTTGAVWQGRYSLPLLVMVPITVALLAAASPRPLRSWFPAVKVFILAGLPIAVIVMLATHVQSIIAQLHRNVGGIYAPNFWTGPWQPWLGPIPLVLIATGIAVAVGIWYLLACAREWSAESNAQPEIAASEALALGT